MGIESAPGKKDAKEREWNEIQKAWDDALSALDPTSKHLDERGKAAEAVDNYSANIPIINISSRGTLKEVEGYLQANISVLSETQRNFLLCSLRVKKFKKDNGIQ